MPILGTVASQFSSKPFGSYESIATSTVGVGGATDITFSDINSNYAHLQVRIIARTTQSNSNVNLRFQVNGDTGSNYSFHQMYAYGSSIGAEGGGNMSFGLTMQSPGSTSSGNMFGIGILDILEYKNTNIYKTFRLLGGNDQNTSTEGFSNFISTNWRSTSAITSLKFYYPAGNLAQYSQVALYGIKES